MTTPISQDIGVLSSGCMFTSFDEKVCRVVCEGFKEKLESFLQNGLSPDYCLQQSVCFKDFVFSKGSSLIFIVVQCFLKTSFHPDLLEMIKLLLLKNVDLEKPSVLRGGGTTVLEFACENASLFPCELLCLLLSSVSTETTLRALNKIEDPERKKEIQKQLSLTSLSSPLFSLTMSPSSIPSQLPVVSPVLLSELPSSFSIDENELCRSLLEGEEEKFRSFILILSSNYILKTSVDIDGFLCRLGESLLMIALRAFVVQEYSFQVIESLSILIENNVNLEQPCLGVLPLHYLCENEDLFSEDIVSCLLTSVSKQTAFSALENILDERRKAKFTEMLTEKNYPFHFDEDEQPSCSYDFKSCTTSSSVKIFSNESSLLTSSEESNKSEQGSETTSKTHPYSKIFSKTVTDVSEKISPIFSEKQLSDIEVIDIENLLLQITGENFSELKKILSTSGFLEVYDKYLQVNFQMNLICFLFSKLENKELIYKACRYFFEYGFSPNTIITPSKTFLDFVCEVRSQFLVKDFPSAIYLQVLCLSLFFNSDPISITSMIEKISGLIEKKLLKIFFQDDSTISSLKTINIETMLSNYSYFSLLVAFVDASLIKNTNVVTQQTWDINTYFSILTSFMTYFCNLKSYSKISCTRKKNRSCQVFSSLLESGLHFHNFREENRLIFVSWLQNTLWNFKNLGLKKEIVSLLQKHWSCILLPKAFDSKNFETNTIFQIPLRFYFLSYMEILEGFISTTIESEINVCLSTVKTHLELFIASEINPITQRQWNFQDLCCLLSSVIVELSKMTKTGGRLTVYQYTIKNILLYLIEALFVVSIKPEFLIENTTNAYVFIEKEISFSKMNNETSIQCFYFLKKYWKEERKNCFSSLSFDETYLCRGLLEGDEHTVRNLLENNLSPDYVLKNSVNIDGFLCHHGESLLLIVLRAYVEMQCSMKVVESLALLIEHKVNLEQSCLGVNPLHYLCEHENMFSEDVVTCLLNSLSKKSVFSALEHVKNPIRRDMFKKILNSKAIDKELGCSEDTWSLSKFLSNPLSNTESSEESCQSKKLLEIVSTTSSSISNESSISGAFVCNGIEPSTQNSLVSETIKLEFLLLEIDKENFLPLEKILSNSKLLKEYDDYIKTARDKESLFYFLVYYVTNKNLLYKVCRCFFKHGFSTNTLVFGKNSCFDMIFSLREWLGVQVLSDSTYVQLLCLAVFFHTDPISIKQIEEKLKFAKYKKLLGSFFRDHSTGASVQTVCIENIVNKRPYFPLIIAFLDVSLIKNTNIVTKQPWNTETFFIILNAFMTLLCNTKSCSNSEAIRVKDILLNAFTSVVELGLHPYNFQENKRCLFVSWLQRTEWFFLNPEMEIEAWSLLQKYWSSLLLPKTSVSEIPSTSIIFSLPIRKYFLSYDEIIETFIRTTIQSNTNLCLASVQTQLEYFVTYDNLITKTQWNFQDLTCLLSSVINKLSEIMHPKKQLTVYEIKILFILKCLPDLLLLFSIKPEFFIEDKSIAYTFIEKEINQRTLNTETKVQLRCLLNKYWGTGSSISQVSGKRKREND